MNSDYTILEAMTLSNLARQVRIYVTDGYIPIGSIIRTNDGGYAQAVHYQG